MVAQGDGLPLRDHLTSLARMSGRQDPRLNATCPEEWAHVWEWFKTLSNRRVRPAAVSFADIDGWCRFNRLQLHPRERKALLQLDDLFRTIVWNAS